ncbi:Scr1 family TA system antitoxin-like transcriptional regulator [Streptomyces sp. NPDC008159]|uniref:Scr1 family TA system antitoxin-like transcriptional regulator n=1 Tax=Streptomyces sp. NPDC008159 TaxID=3364817 RepID=UPI0036E8ED5D
MRSVVGGTRIGGVLNPVYEDLISLEAEAESVSSWQLGAIPGLLHTAEYAREIIRATAMSEAVEARVDALVEVRLARQGRSLSCWTKCGPEGGAGDPSGASARRRYKRRYRTW